MRCTRSSLRRRQVEGHWTITANLDHLRRYHRAPPAEQSLIDEADLVVADGMPLIWASRLAGEPLPERAVRVEHGVVDLRGGERPRGCRYSC